MAPNRGGGGHHRLLTRFFPCKTHRVNVKILYSRRDTVPPVPPPMCNCTICCFID